MSDEGGPYRVAEAPAPAPRQIECPSCLSPIAADVRRCGHCDVLLERMRCRGCYALTPPGERACRRCGTSQAFDRDSEADDAPCPRCRKPLAREPTGGLRSCDTCGGVLVDHATLAALVREVEANPAGRPSLEARRSGSGRMVLDEVRYLPCPDCATSMNRRNFGRTSGVIVDVCMVHGTWFDAGELTRTVSFVAGGGLARARALEEAEERRARDRRVEARATPHPASRRELERDLAGTSTGIVDWLIQLLTGW